jgi:hypothetical protein
MQCPLLPGADREPACVVPDRALLLAMPGGGVLVGLWRPLCFLLAALVLAAVTRVVFWAVVDESRRQATTSTRPRGGMVTAWRLLRRPPTSAR